MTLLLSACRIESNVLLDINEDGSATIDTEIGFDEAMLDLISSGGDDPSEILQDLPGFGDDNVVPTTRTEGDMTYFGVSTQVADLSNYDFSGFQIEMFPEFSYTFDASSATLTAAIDMEGLGGSDGDELLFDLSDLADDVFSAKLVVMMPGTVTEHNADEERADGALVWNLPIAGSLDILAISQFGDSPASWIWIVVAVVILVGVATMTGAVVMSKRGPEKAVAAAATAHQESERAQPASEHDEDAASDEPDEPSGTQQPDS